MKAHFKISFKLSASPQEVFKAWLDSEKHSAMTGAEAECSAEEGAIFSAWDGYIRGKNLRINPGKCVEQQWWTTDFKKDDPHSIIRVEFKSFNTGCEVFLEHSYIPEGQPDYEKGWQEFYIEPMQNYFGKLDG